MPLEIDLAGRTALVTGASRGIGAAIAGKLAAAGADIVGIGTSIDSGSNALREGVEGQGVRFIPMNCDLSDRAQISGLISRLADQRLQIDILVNNAGIIRRTAASDHAAEDWDAVMAVNLDAAFLLSRDLGKLMAERGAGKIINVASVLSFQGGILVPGYAASKGAIVQLTKALANEWAAKGVNVNAVAPGYIATDNTAALQADAKRSAELMSRVPVKRWGTPDEIAGPVAFLASDLADFIHGAVLAVDGGWLAR